MFRTGFGQVVAEDDGGRQAGAANGDGHRRQRVAGQRQGPPAVVPQRRARLLVPLQLRPDAATSAPDDVMLSGSFGPAS